MKIQPSALLMKPSAFCHTFSYAVIREEHRLRVFENTMLRRIFGPK
jgi:hypothetical protein